MNLTRLLSMRPDEIRTRAQQALAKRWASPPACHLISSSAVPVFPDLPTLCTLQQAKTICQHRFDLLGYEALDFGSPIDWHLDPVHHKRAPRKPWYQIPFLDFNLVGDHKIIWELNRHQHLVTLAQAGFRDEILAQWTHWQQENPYPIGINWASTLEVAFRALSWLWVRHIIGDFHDDLLPALHLHGWYIERFLSTYFSPNTHLLGEGVALFAIGVLCPQIRDARRWQERGWNIVLRQAEVQVRPDGFHFEQSVYYHVYALDFFQFARTLAARNAIPVPAPFDRTIEKMSEALAAISQAGLAPNFGDDDGGRVLGSPARPLTRSPAQQPSRSIALPSDGSPDPLAPLPARPPRENILPSAGGRALGSPARPLTPSPAQQPSRSIALTSSGIYAMTDPHSQLFIDAGPQGVFAGGHSHADALSVQLVMDCRPVLIDSGTFCYTCPERDRSRGTAAHNTLQVDGRDQAKPAGPFAWTGMPETTVDRWVTNETSDFFAGHHNGYAPIIHHRWVFGLKSKFWLVRDTVTGPGRHRLDSHWHFLDERDLAILPPAGHNWSESIAAWDWSPVYGKKEPAFVRRFSTEAALPAEFAVLLAPREAGIFTQSAPGVYRYEEPQGSHEFSFAPTADARLVYRSIGPDGTKEFAL